MDQQLIAQKLDSLRRCVQRVESRMPASLEQLQRDVDAQDIVALNLTRAVQMCIDIGAHWLAVNGKGESPKTMGEVFAALAEAGLLSHALSDRLRRSVGFRNIVVHNYGAVNWEIVYGICAEHLSDFKDFARVFSDLVEPGESR